MNGVGTGDRPPRWRESPNHLFIAAVVTICLVVAIALVVGINRGPAQPMRVLPLGDSITDGWRYVPGGYRIRLWERLVQADHDKIDFVGSLHNGPPELGDPDHEGHSGWRIDQLSANIDGWMGTYQPDAVLLHIGTNDVLQDYQLATAPARLEHLVGRICIDRPGVQVAVASIVPRPKLEAQVDAYNATIPALVDRARAGGCAATFVDMNAALTEADIDESATHPTRAGYDKMADAWYPVVQAMYDRL